MEKWSDKWIDEYFDETKHEKELSSKTGDRWMLKNSAGENSASLTLLVIASIIVFTRFFIGGLELKVGGLQLGLKDVNALELSAFITPFITLYFGRRWTAARTPSPSSGEAKKLQEETKK